MYLRPVVFSVKLLANRQTDRQANQTKNINYINLTIAVCDYNSFITWHMKKERENGENEPGKIYWEKFAHCCGIEKKSYECM